MTCIWNLGSSNYYYNWRCFFDLAPQVMKNGKWCNSQKTLSCGAVTGVGFMLIDAVLWLQSQFEDSTLCIADDSKILLLCAFWLKIKWSNFNSIGKGKAFHGLLRNMITCSIFVILYSIIHYFETYNMGADSKPFPWLQIHYLGVWGD